MKEVKIKLRGIDGHILVFNDRNEFADSVIRISEIAKFKRAIPLHEHVRRDNLNLDNVNGAFLSEEHVMRFLPLFMNKMSEGEKRVLDVVGEHSVSQKWFVVAVMDTPRMNDVLVHEMSHVLYHYDEEFRRELNEAWDGISHDMRSIAAGHLIGEGYKEDEIVNEFFAHLSYGFHSDAVDWFKSVRPLYERVTGEIKSALATVRDISSHQSE